MRVRDKEVDAGHNGNRQNPLAPLVGERRSGAGEIAVKKMMGDYCIYCNGILFGLICDNNLYIKMTDAGEAVLEEVVLRPPYPSARDHFYITNVDDRDYLEDIIRATLPELMLKH